MSDSRNNSSGDCCSHFSGLTSGFPSAAVSFAAGLHFQDISYFCLPNQEILREITLSVEPGEILCLLGPSGSGKTTLLRIAAGIERQTSGNLFLNERKISGSDIFVPPELRSIGLVFQDCALFPHLSILENVRFGLTALSREQGFREALLALSRVGLEHYAHLYPHVLSGGEQQRVALARALVPRPAVILMDEPFSGLDSRLRDSIRLETLDALRSSCTTAIIVTHDAEEAMRMGDRIAVLCNGSLVQVGRSEDLYLRPVNLFTAGFFSELNVFSGCVQAGYIETPVGKILAQYFEDGVCLNVAIRTTGFDLNPFTGTVPVRIISRHYLGVFELFDLVAQGFEKPIRAKNLCGIIAPDVRDIWLTVRNSDVLLFKVK